MRFIVSGITLLTEYLKKLEDNPELFRPPTCLNCGKSGLWCHGQYHRKADYERSGEHSLNPIPVFRFYCPNCCQTCSALPECIPPLRHTHGAFQWVAGQIRLLISAIIVNHNTLVSQLTHDIVSQYTIFSLSGAPKLSKIKTNYVIKGRILYALIFTTWDFS